MIEYDVFEVLADKSLIWRACASGVQAAIYKLEAVGRHNTHDCFAINLRTRELFRITPVPAKKPCACEIGNSQEAS
jgi:hypothetical protein